MCGIVGCWQPSGSRAREALEVTLRRMAATVAHRGPDAEGFWIDSDAGFGLGHRRLSVIDPTDAGGQPMVSQNQRFVVSYNGEIYNFLELRKELEDGGCLFRGGSDTEVLVEGFGAWGVESTLTKINGMFALAVWDRQQQKLHLARDRLGIKPLYWGRLDNVIVFGSELKALAVHPRWTGKIPI